MRGFKQKRDKKSLNLCVIISYKRVGSLSSLSYMGFMSKKCRIKWYENKENIYGNICIFLDCFYLF